MGLAWSEKSSHTSYTPRVTEETLLWEIESSGCSVFYQFCLESEGLGSGSQSMDSSHQSVWGATFNKFLVPDPGLDELLILFVGNSRLWQELHHFSFNPSVTWLFYNVQDPPNCHIHKETCVSVRPDTQDKLSKSNELAEATKKNSLWKRMSAKEKRSETTHRIYTCIYI